MQDFKGSCHCGKIQFVLKGKPEWLTECNCSLCTRIGARWAHADCTNVELKYHKDDIIAYIQGDKTLATVSCKCCGCTTHWENLQPAKYNRMAVNFRMCNDDISAFRIRRFDGADTWVFLD